MNLFKAIGSIITAITETIVTTANAATVTASAVEDVAHMAKDTTESMRRDLKEQSDQDYDALVALRPDAAKDITAQVTETKPKAK